MIHSGFAGVVGLLPSDAHVPYPTDGISVVFPPATFIGKLFGNDILVVVSWNCLQMTYREAMLELLTWREMGLRDCIGPDILFFCGASAFAVL